MNSITQKNSEGNNLGDNFFDKLQDTGTFNMFNYPEFAEFDFKGKYDPETKFMWFSREDLMYNLDIEESTLSRRIKRIFRDGELKKDDISVLVLNTTTANDKKNYDKEYFSHKMSNALAMGARKKRAIAFKKWFNKVVSNVQEKARHIEFDRVDYFELDELITSGKRDFDKILKFCTDTIAKNAIDYSECLKNGKTNYYFPLIKNKLYHYATGRKAVEIKYDRANSEKINMGLTYVKDPKKGITITDAKTASYYLVELEYAKIIRIVQAWKGSVESFTLNKFQLKIRDYINELDFLIIRQRVHPIETNSSAVKNEECNKKIREELDKYSKNVKEGKIVPFQEK